MIATGRASILGSRSTISGWAAIPLSPKCTARLTTECVAASIIQRPSDLTAQFRLAQAEAMVTSARLFLFDTVSRVWHDVLAGREATVEARVLSRLASWHAVTSAAQAVDLVYLTGGATSLYESCPIERAFRDVDAFTQHIGVHPRLLETTGRVLFGLEPDVPSLML